MVKIKKIILSISLLFMMLPVFLKAQSTSREYTITGEMSCDSLRFSPQLIKQLYLVKLEDGIEKTVDTSIVKNKKFFFKGIAPDKLDVYFIKGFDNGTVQVFLEPGNIIILPFDAKFPTVARVIGTTNNNVINEYNNLMDSCTQLALSKAKELDKWFNNEGKNLTEDEKLKYRGSQFYINSLKYKTATMTFLKDNFDKEAALFLIKFNIVPMFDSKIIEREFLRAVSSNMKTHPVYKEMVNQIKANNLKEGNPAPDIEGKTPSGRVFSLSDLKGKYVLLDFWASWCGPCRREMPYIKEALKISEENDNFRVLSYSIDSKEKDWVNCIESNDYKHKNWIHVSTLKGWNTEAAKLFNVSAVPYTVLLNPNGEVIAFNIRGEEMVKKVSNIIKGIEK